MDAAIPAATSRVRRAMVPAAGRGTRMRPFSDLVPKELVPLGARPALDFVAAEARAAGIAELVLITAPGKELLERWAEGAREEWGMAITLVRQEEPRGLGDAILCAAAAVGDASFALLLPDNVILSPAYRLGRLLELHVKHGRDVVGVIEVGHARSGEFGNSGRFRGTPLGDDALSIDRLDAKGEGRLEVPPGATVRRTCGRYVCSPALLAELAALRAVTDGELDEVPAYQRLAAREGMVGALLPEPLFDIGHPSGLLAANAWLHARAVEEGTRPLTG